MLWRTPVKIWSWFIVSLTAASIPAVLFAQPAMPAALPEDMLPPLKHLLEVATSQSPNMVAANLDVVSADAQRIVDRSGLWPSVGGYGRYARTESAVSSNTDYRSTTSGPLYGISLSQPVFYFGALKNQAEIGTLRLRMAERQYAEVYRGLVASIRSQYLTLVQKKVQLRNQRYNVKAAENYLAVQEARLRDGRISTADITAPRLQVDEARIYADRALEDYEYSRRMLAKLVGLPDLADDSVVAELPKPVFAPETIGSFFEEMKRSDFENTATIQNLVDTVKQNELNYKIQKVRLYPKFSVSANYDQVNQTNVDAATKRPILTAITTTTYGVGGTWTIFDGFATRGAKLSALAAKRLAEQKLKSTKETMGETARSLEKQIGFAGRLMDLTEVRKELARAAVEKVSNDVKSGVSPQSLLDTITQNANTAELAAVGARAEFLSRWSDYVSLLGADPALNNLPARYLRNGK